MNKDEDFDLAAEAATLTREVQGLRTEVTNVDNKRKTGNVVIGLMITLLALGVIVMGAVGYQVYDCTVEGGGCYERNTRATAEAVQTLQLITIYANQCSLENHETPNQIQNCVEDKLAQK